MLRKARYRVALCVLLLVCAYITLEMLASPYQPPWQSRRLAFTVYTDSLDSKDFKFIESSDTRSIDGIYLAVVLIQIIESPIYYRDEFDSLWMGFMLIDIGKRIEIGWRAEMRPGISFTGEANQASVDIEDIKSPEFLRSMILGVSSEHDLTPAMEQVLRYSPLLGGKDIHYPRFLTAIIANIIWLLGWLTLVFEGILAYLRGRRRKHQRHHDLCLRCSYQLTRDLHQCPECGTQINWRSYSPEARV